MKLVFVILILLQVVFIKKIQAQLPNSDNVGVLLSQLHNSYDDSIRIEILHNLGKSYLLRRGENKIHLDSSITFFKAAIRLSEARHIDRGLGKYESLCRLGEAYFQLGNIAEGKKCFMRVINDYHKAADKEREARTWQRLARKSNLNATTYSELLQYLNRALLLYRQSKKTDKVMHTMISIADVHLTHGKLHLAEQKLLHSLALSEKLKTPYNPDIYMYLSLTCRYKGELDKGLLYALKGVSYIEKNKVDPLFFNEAFFFNQLGYVYRELGQPQKSVESYQKAVAKWQALPHLHYESNITHMYKAAGYLAEELIKQKKEKEAYNLIQGLIQKYGMQSTFEKARVAQTLGQYYQTIGKSNLAEKQFAKMARWYEKAVNGYVNLDDESMDYIPEMNYSLGNFYVNLQQYQKAEFYLQKVLQTGPETIPLSNIKNLHLLLYQVDSAAGNYLQAMQHFRRHKALSDIIFNNHKTRQIAELQIQYETEKKEQNIRWLNQQNKIQDNKIQQATELKNITFAGVCLLLVIIGLLYNQFQIKQRSNNQLQAKQTEIEEKNNYLLQLVQEKEWLLKEIHHRVKNNLHTITSLLESQSIFLKDDALLAIQNSQHRVFAMSLIHQRLYLSDSITTVDMSQYLQELVNYLQDSFNIRQQIMFKLQLEPVELDVSQAVPLGLILNEAITNSVKYAFPGDSNGVISISIAESENNQLMLYIRDNGIGLPLEFDVQKSTSLGIKLMQGLTEDLGGQFKITSQEGTHISVIFSIDRFLQNLQKTTKSEQIWAEV